MLLQVFLSRPDPMTWLGLKRRSALHLFPKVKWMEQLGGIVWAQEASKTEQGSTIGTTMGNSGNNVLLILGFIICIHSCTSSEGKTFMITIQFANAFYLFTILSSVVFSTIQLISSLNHAGLRLQTELETEQLKKFLYIAVNFPLLSFW